MVDVKKVLEESHKYNATLTAFLSAVLVKSIIDEMPVRSKGKKPITILIPVIFATSSHPFRQETFSV